jgi:hypothetical protein
VCDLEVKLGGFSFFVASIRAYDIR